MTATQIIADDQLDAMCEIIAELREHAHRVAHARHRGDVDTINNSLAAIEALYQHADREVLAAALLERLFAADWEACQSTLTLPHLLP